MADEPYCDEDDTISYYDEGEENPEDGKLDVLFKGLKE